MIVTRWWARVDRAQRTPVFKVVASLLAAAILAAGVVALLWLVRGDEMEANERVYRWVEGARQAELVRGSAWINHGPLAVFTKLAHTAGQLALTPEGWWTLSWASALVLGISLLVIWLGLGATYTLLLVLGVGVAWPLMAWGPTRGFGQVLLGVTPLTMALLVLLEGAKLALSAAVPLTAVARNVLVEAVRMKISLVFIVLVLLLLAGAPGMLDPEQPLRYRVQQWFQYGTGLSFALLGIMTLFFAAATVAFEQRDRVIWQTMTKPVPAWQYIAGKWLGVMVLNGVLLTVTAAGVYLFTEYLRRQPAQGEVAWLVRLDGVPEMTEDRRLLETQVLVSRIGIRPDEPVFDDAEIRPAIELELQDMRSRDPNLVESPELLERLRRDALLALRAKHYSVDPDHDGLRGPNTMRQYVFESERLAVLERTLNIDQRIALQAEYQKPETSAERKDQIETQLRSLPSPVPMTLRYKINAGTNDPADLYTFVFDINGVANSRPIQLKQAQVFDFDSSWIREGKLVLTVYNPGSNERTITFPSDGLEVLYPQGSYALNFVRIMAAMWVKLGLLGAVAIAAASVLNFPVACFLTMVVFFAAESSPFLRDAMEQYPIIDNKRQFQPLNFLVRATTEPIIFCFTPYSDLRPTESLVDGRLVGWGSLLGALAKLGLACMGILGIGLAFFRRKELAIYSGQ